MLQVGAHKRFFVSRRPKGSERGIGFLDDLRVATRLQPLGVGQGRATRQLQELHQGLAAGLSLAQVVYEAVL
ncbi:MAG: hypothetical protein CL434_14210 [Acidimicrobiaceae bacterium]|nr:hypothetical protein [Acidimicrobiaceae bacterium]